MAEGKEEQASTAKVRNLIFAYERHLSTSEALENSGGRQRSKSIGNSLSYKLFRQPNLEIHNIIDIEKELVKIEAHLNYYEVYEKETHVAFQEQLFNVLTSIVSIDPEEHESTIEKKRHLIGETQKLAKILNSKLPFNGNPSSKGLQKSYSSVVRREEAIVSTTSSRSHEHKAILTSQHSFNGGFKSEESLNSTKDSVDISSRHEDSSSVDLNRIEDRPESATPPPQKKIVSYPEPSYIPSVSKLKKFFSFRRDDRSEVNVIPAAYSGVSRSQSLNLKTSRYTVTKKESSEDLKKKEEIITENEEDESVSDRNLITSSPIQNRDENCDQSNLPYHENVGEIEEYREVQRETQHNVSVSKLKSLFEDRQKETDEGLRLLTTNQQTEFRSEFILPYTEANLGAFRLKKTLSGNYMNFTGLLRSVDISKKGDMNKSKSMSDLKSESLRYSVRDIDIDDDLSKEIDDLDDDFGHVSISTGKEAEELNNNNVARTVGTHHSEHISNHGEITSQTSEPVVFRKVENLKKNFEKNSRENSNEDIKHIIHRTIYPIPNSAGRSEEPVLKIPIQLRTGFGHLSHSEETKENISSENSNEDIKHIIHRTIDPIQNSTGRSGEPVLKIPIQLRTGFGHVSHSEETKENITENVLGAEHITETAPSDSEPLLQVPVQLRIGALHSISSEETKKNISSENSNEDIKHIIHRTIDPIQNSTGRSGEPVLKVPIQLRTGFGHVSHSEETKENITENVLGAEHITETAASDSEPGLQVPVQLRIGALHSISSEETKSSLSTENSHRAIDIEENLITGKVEALKHTFEHISVKTTEESNDETNPVLHGKTEPISCIPNSIKEQFLKLPRTDLPAFSHNDEHLTDIAPEKTSENNISANESANISSGSVEVLKQTFENLNRRHSMSNGEVKNTIHRTIEPIENTTDASDEPILKIPIQLRGGFLNNSAEILVAENSNEESIQVKHSEEASDSNSQESKSDYKLSKPQLRINGDVVLYDNSITETNSDTVPISLYNGSPVVSEESESKEKSTVSRAQISSNTETFMKMLETPATFSVSTSNSSYGQSQHVSSSSKVSVSYSAKRTVQHTSSTSVSQRIVSSSSSSSQSSQLSTQKYLSVLTDQNSPSSLTSKSPDASNKESNVTITEVEEEREPKVNLNVSQENIIDEILRDSGDLENVDEEFEKMLQEDR